MIIIYTMDWLCYKNFHRQYSAKSWFLGSQQRSGRGRACGNFGNIFLQKQGITKNKNLKPSVHYISHVWTETRHFFSCLLVTTEVWHVLKAGWNQNNKLFNLITQKVQTPSGMWHLSFTYNLSQPFWWKPVMCDKEMKGYTLQKRLFFLLYSWLW